jgi:hypothetical protein
MFFSFIADTPAVITKKPRKNRSPIIALDTQEVQLAAEKLVSSNSIFIKQDDITSSFARYDFTTDAEALETCIPRTLRAYHSNTKMVFFAEVARGVTAIIYHLQMETLKKIDASLHADMLCRIKENSILSNSELNRLKLLGSRLCKLTQACGLASLAVLACVSCSRIIECTNEAFDRFQSIVSGHHFKTYDKVTFNDELFRQFQVFYQQSITYQESITTQLIKNKRGLRH